MSDYKDEWRHPEELLEFAGLFPGAKVLDVTTGFGYLAKRAARLTKTTVDAQNGSEWRGFFDSVGIDKEIENMAQQNVQHYFSPLEQPALGKEDYYDFILMQNTFHDFFEMPMDRSKFFDSIKIALKKDTGRLLLVDHSAAHGRGTKDAGANHGLHRIEKSAAIDEVESNGLVVEKESDMFVYPDDDKTTCAWTNPMKQTDRFVLLCKKKAAY